MISPFALISRLDLRALLRELVHRHSRAHPVNSCARMRVRSRVYGTTVTITQLPSRAGATAKNRVHFLPIQLACILDVTVVLLLYIRNNCAMPRVAVLEVSGSRLTRFENSGSERLWGARNIISLQVRKVRRQKAKTASPFKSKL